MPSIIPPLRAALWVPWASVNSTVRYTTFPEQLDMLPTIDHEYLLFLICGLIFITTFWLPGSWDRRVQGFIDTAVARVWRQVSGLVGGVWHKMSGSVERAWSAVLEFRYEMLSGRQFESDGKIVTDIDANSEGRTVKAIEDDTQDTPHEQVAEGIQDAAHGPNTSNASHTPVTSDTSAATAIPLNIDTHKPSNTQDTLAIPDSSNLSNNLNVSETIDHNESLLVHKTQEPTRTDSERSIRRCDGVRTRDSEIMEWVNVSRQMLPGNIRSDGEKVEDE